MSLLEFLVTFIYSVVRRQENAFGRKFDLLGTVESLGFVTILIGWNKVTVNKLVIILLDQFK